MRDSPLVTKIDCVVVAFVSLIVFVCVCCSFFFILHSSFFIRGAGRDLDFDLGPKNASRAMMEYGQSSGMVNVDGTMMPDPTKHPELEAMVRSYVTSRDGDDTMSEGYNRGSGARTVRR